MIISEHLRNNRTELSISFELIPPKFPITRREFIEIVRPLMEVGPLFVDVTAHRPDLALIVNNGKISGSLYNHRPNSLLICEALRSAYDVEVMPHILCGDATLESMKILMQDLNFLDYENLMILRGDKLQYEKVFNSEFMHSLDLMSHINDYCNEWDIAKPSFASACYPERHSSSLNEEFEHDYNFSLVSEGTKMFISQMFFDNSKFEEFYKRTRSLGVPIIPGLKVLSSHKQALNLPQHFNVSIPNELEKNLLVAKDAREVGIEWCVQQCKGLIAMGHKHLHFFTMNSTLVLQVLKKIL